MKPSFEELDYRPTPIGALSLRRRREMTLGIDVYEIKLGEEFLMSSLFTVAEIELARLGLAATRGDALDVVVGGLGLGYTARAALDEPRVRSLLVVDALPEVIEWHEEGLLPLGPGLTADPRCRLVHGDFFTMATGLGGQAGGFDAQAPDRLFHAVLLDIDHSPRKVLTPANAAFYEPAGLSALRSWLHPGGVFAIWSNDPPDDGFTETLAEIFAEAEAHVVRFPNPLQGRDATNTVYVARTPDAD